MGSACWLLPLNSAHVLPLLTCSPWSFGVVGFFLLLFIILMIIIINSKCGFLHGHCNHHHHQHHHHHQQQVWSMPGALLAARFLLPRPGPVRPPHYIHASSSMSLSANKGQNRHSHQRGHLLRAQEPLTQCTMRRSPLQSVNRTIYQNVYLAPHFFQLHYFR